MRAAARPGRVALLALIVALSPTAARGDWLFTPFIGSSFGASTTYLTLDPDREAIRRNRLAVGGSGAWLADRGIGVEAELAFVPDFFSDDILLRKSSVVTLFGNVIAAVPVAVTRESLRPYVIGGLGLIRASGEDPAGLFENDRVLGLQLGGGAIGFVSERVGLRFDLRHTRAVRRGEDPVTLERKTKVSFWRVSVGVVLGY